MASQNFTVASTLSPADAFAMLVDLTRVNEWDRGVSDSKQIGGTGPGLDARYQVTVTGFDGEPSPVVYTLVEYEPNQRFVMIGENADFRAHDTVTIAESADGCEVTYDARLELLGDNPPLTSDELDALFAKVADIPRRGLGTYLNP